MDVYEPKTWQMILVTPIYFFVRLWQATIRMKTSAVNYEMLSNPKRIIGLAWHSRIFFLPICKYTYRPKFPMSGLVSASKDASYLCAFFRLMGIGTVRGSSRRRGAGAIFGLVERLQTSDVFITPDGPRGPKNIAKAGFTIVAKESGVRILLLRIIPSCGIRLKSWDGFFLPLPFSSVNVEVRKFENFDELETLAKSRDVLPEILVSKFLNGENV